jgi:hypothetical protein
VNVGGINDIGVCGVTDVIRRHDRLIPAKSDPGASYMEGGWNKDQLRLHYFNPPVEATDGEHPVCIVISGG